MTPTTALANLPSTAREATDATPVHHLARDAAALAALLQKAASRGRLASIAAQAAVAFRNLAERAELLALECTVEAQEGRA
jgi:hypothetical protein